MVVADNPAPRFSSFSVFPDGVSSMADTFRAIAFSRPLRRQLALTILLVLTIVVQVTAEVLIPSERGSLSIWSEWITPQTIMSGVLFIYALGMFRQQVQEEKLKLRALETEFRRLKEETLPNSYQRTDRCILSMDAGQKQLDRIESIVESLMQRHKAD